MHKDNINSQTNQDCNANSFTKNKRIAGPAFKNLLKNPNPNLIYQDLKEKKWRGKGTAFDVMDILLKFQMNGKLCFYTLETWLEKTGGKVKHTTTMSNLLKKLELAGYIRRVNRAGSSVVYILNPVFGKQEVQQAIYPLFSWMKVLAFSMLLSVSMADGGNGRGMEELKRPLIQLIDYDPNLSKLGSYINSFCGSVESCDAKRSEGVPRKERRRVKDRGETESFYWSRGEKIAREGLEYDVDPADTCINKRSIECLFVQGNALLEATSESFDNREYDTLWEIDMSRPVPYLTEDETWEEVYDPPVGDDYPVSPRTEPDISYPDISDEEVAVSDSDSEVEESFEYVKIQLDSVVPIMPVDTGERLISNPTKPWNAPAWRKVAGGGDVETLTEFINRVTKKKGNYD
jgi:hypothetical protein